MQTVTRALTVALAAGLAAPALAQTDIFWNAGSGVWSDPANWAPVNVPNAANENALILSPALANITLDITATILGLEVGPQITLTHSPNTTLSLSGNLVNNGLVVLNPSGNISNAVIQFNGNATISGGGILRLAGGENDASVNTNATTVTNALGHTIDGAGQIPATIINNGTISAIDTGFGNRLELIGGTKTNNLNMQAESGAELFISAITVNQAPAATISANSGGTVIFSSSPTINGGTIQAAEGGTLLKPSSGNLKLSDISLQGELEVADSAGVLYNSDAFDCQGGITLNDSGSVNNAFIQFNANTTVSGGGSIFLAGGGNDSQVITNATTLTIAPDFTIEGSGELRAATVNNGLIRAFPSDNGDGRLRLISSGKTNNTLILADTGGVIEINGVTINQGPAGEILADDGTVEFALSQTINGGAIRAANGGMLVKPSSGNLSLSNISLQGELGVSDSAGILYNSDVFDCQGGITLNDTGSVSNAFIQFNANTTISGGGRIFLAGGGNDSQVITNATTLTIAPDFTVEGSGEIPAAIVNNGMLRAFPSANGDGRLRLIGGSKANTNQILADAGGVVEINGVILTQSPTGEILADEGAVEFVGSQTVNGGTIRTANGGTLGKPPGGNLSMSDIVLEGDLDIAGNAGVFYNSAVFTGTGSVNLNDSSSTSNAIMQFNASTTLTGGGRIFLAGGANDSQVITNATVVTVAPDFAIEGSGEIPAMMVNNGLVRAFPSANGDGRLRLIGSGKGNNAQMAADAGGVLEINSVVISQGTGGEILADAGIVEFSGSPTVNGGTLRADNGGRLRRLGNGNLSLGGEIALESDLELEAPTTLLVNSAVMTNNATVRINTTGSTSNAFIQFNANTVIGGTGRFFLEGTGNDSQMTTNATTATFGPGQTIEGDGFMNGSYIVQGRVEPGLPLGNISGSASIMFGSSAEFIADVVDNGNGDSINVTGTVTPGGAVSIHVDPGYVPAIDDEFTLITAGTVVGEFAGVAVTSGVLPPDVAVRLDHTPNSVNVNFVCLADLLAPFGVLDLIDIGAFVDAFLNQQPAADLAAPIGIFDLADIGTFVNAFTTTCQ